MGEYVDAGKVTDFSDGVIRTIKVNGAEVAIVSSGGKYYAFGNQCPHLGFSLADGEINSSDQVICAYHGSVFNLASGEVADGPSDDGLTLYSVRIEGDSIQVGPTD